MPVLSNVFLVRDPRSLPCCRNLSLCNGTNQKPRSGCCVISEMSDSTDMQPVYAKVIWFYSGVEGKQTQCTACHHCMSHYSNVENNYPPVYAAVSLVALSPGAGHYNSVSRQGKILCTNCALSLLIWARKHLYLFKKISCRHHLGRHFPTLFRHQNDRQRFPNISVYWTDNKLFGKPVHNYSNRRHLSLIPFETLAPIVLCT